MPSNRPRTPVAEVCRKMGISEATFYKREEEVWRAGPIQLKLISIAKERIFEPDKSISQIAYELGFRYPQHFSRMFKEHVGSSPSEYRKEN